MLSKKTVLVGRMRRNSVELPSTFANGKEREINSTIFGFPEDSMILSYCSKKNYVFTLMSTMHSQPSIDSKNAEKKPKVIICYSKTKGGIDTPDKMLHLQSFKDKRRQCLIQLGKELVGVNARQEHDKQSSSSANILQPNKKRRRSSTSFEISQPKKKGRCFFGGPKKDKENSYYM
ncbi:uncharacterized protein LOC115216547 [Octopus sinensis]|uniref:Uncharacterized protein LOC115216547 n=1 Tax=Octopus sinensis TaxID=2607531 RepID=A0A6P7SUF3_9MOLL|nr:uncharacterized protein LOC115216547 [Octopus sinensis]